MRNMFLAFSMLGATFAYAQQPVKKPLDHSVYDSWQSIGTQLISNNGQWVVYTVTPQEGDASLVIYDRKTATSVTVPRGSSPAISQDSRHVVFSIKPFYKDTREAKIKKKKGPEMPKDSIGIIELGKPGIVKFPGVKSFKIPAKGSGLLAFLTEKPAADSAKSKKTKTGKDTDSDRADDDKSGAGSAESGMLVIRQLHTGIQDTIKNVADYAISKPGNNLLISITSDKKDSLSRTGVLLWHAATRKADTLSRGYGDYKQFAFDEKGEQAAYFGTRDSARALQQFYQLYYYKPGQDSAIVAVNKNTSGVPSNWTISANSLIYFSEEGKRLFFGTAPVLPAKDTTIVDFEVAKVDIWNYKDDYLQPMQLKNADKELKRSYAAVYYPAARRMIQLADKDMETVVVPAKNDGPYALGYTDKGERISLQWIGRTLKTAYLINLEDGTRKKIKDRLDGFFLISPAGNYISWYDLVNKEWVAYNNTAGTTVNMSKGITTAVFDEEDDHPDVPEAYGMAGWMQDDQAVLIYDRYDIWQADPSGKRPAFLLTGGEGRRNKIRFRQVRLDAEQKFFKADETLILSAFSDSTRYNGYYSLRLPGKSGKIKQQPKQLVFSPNSYPELIRAKDAPVYAFTRASYTASPDVYTGEEMAKAVKISSTNPQQQSYNWGTAELYKWTTFSGKQAEGILYKPEDFDSNKKYPVIFYFYEKLTDGLFNYHAPAPTPSRLNISFFVSRGYLVFAPDITYENGYPGKSAYDYIVSAAEDIARKPWADGKNMGIQGQSWGGYQVAYLITQTPLFKAAWAGAPVANMTSAYGGIRWESGMNRQFQYEHSQSRIGATLWEKPELYIENSPLFNLPRVTTPLAIMANDADGAVPWYQGIELFTGLRRLGKPVWMLNYNNEAHNLVQRQNRKDIQRREQQFFDHFLKGAPAPQWLESGVPATEKGINWGF
ncbi:prolyl oligopeptidase family serine peptidase [Chitinophaga solisilvae]|nr:prolyl oligopeptidase family serine peptidase [Chitinophaga solisilvae]